MMQPLPTFTPLEKTVREVEEYVSRGGWDQPTRLFVLAKTAEALHTDPSLAALLPEAAIAESNTNPEALTAIEQDGLPEHKNLEELLGQIGFGPAAAGALIVVERITVPPEAEVGLPKDPQAATEALLVHPQRDDVRLVVALMRTGDHLCAIRSRSNDHTEKVATGPDLVPGLVSALAQTLEDFDDESGV